MEIVVMNANSVDKSVDKSKSYSYFFSKHISVYAIFNDQSFNDTLTIDIVSFEQLGPGCKIKSMNTSEKDSNVYVQEEPQSQNIANQWHQEEEQTNIADNKTKRLRTGQKI